MKKYVLLIFVVVACFHDTIESKMDLHCKANTNTVNVTIHSHIDHTFESTTPKSEVEKSFLRAKFMSNTSHTQELYYKIWKPPVVS